MTTVWEKEFQLVTFVGSWGSCRRWPCLHRCTLRLVGKVPPASVGNTASWITWGKCQNVVNHGKNNPNLNWLAGFLNHQQYHVQLACIMVRFQKDTFCFFHFNPSFLVLTFLFFAEGCVILWGSFSFSNHLFWRLSSNAWGAPKISNCCLWKEHARINWLIKLHGFGELWLTPLL